MQTASGSTPYEGITRTVWILGPLPQNETMDWILGLLSQNNKYRLRYRLVTQV